MAVCAGGIDGVGGDYADYQRAGDQGGYFEPRGAPAFRVGLAPQ